MVEARRRRAPPAQQAVRILMMFCALGTGYYLLASSSWAPAGISFNSGGNPGGYTLEEYNVETPTQVHGHLNKAGPIASIVAVGDGGKRDDLAFPPKWRNKRLKGIKEPPPSKWSAIMYSDKYKIIYVKCTKTAGTTLMTYFTDCSEPQPADRCLGRLNYHNATLVRHLLDSWDDYFVFSFSRNVLRRTISQYQYLTTFIKEQKGCPRVSWDEYCQDPYILGDLCHAKHTKGCCTQSAEHQYVHAAPQVDCFTTKDGESALDWLGRVEHFEDDFKVLVGELNARGGDVPQLPTDVLPNKSNYNASPCKPTGGGAAGGGEASSDGESAGGNGSEGSEGNASSGEGGQPQASRRLQGWGWDVREDVENPCDKNDFFRGRHAQCYDAVASFFREDLQLLAPR